MPRRNRNAGHVLRTRNPAAGKPKPDHFVDANDMVERQVSRGETLPPRVHGGYKHSFQIDHISPGRLVAAANYRGGRSGARA